MFDNNFCDWKAFFLPRKRLVRRNAGPSCRLWIKKICITCFWPGSDYSEGMSPTVFCEWEMYLANYTDPISWRSQKMLSFFWTSILTDWGIDTSILLVFLCRVYFHVYSSGEIVLWHRVKRDQLKHASKVRFKVSPTNFLNVFANNEKKWKCVHRTQSFEL